MIDKPIFFIGVPRSGTSFIYETFSKHESLGWISNYQNRLPSLKWISFLNRIFDNPFYYKMGSREKSNKMTSLKFGYPKPTEPYILWNKLSAINFSMDFLLGVSANATIKEVFQNYHKNILRFQRKKRLVNKFTGPSRIEYIKSIFPNAMFIHVVRDGRAVVQSLLDVDFWENGGGYEKIWWQNGQESATLKQWDSSLHKPHILAAYQYRNIMEKTTLESRLLDKENYLEIKFESFLVEPKSYLEKMYAFTGLNKDSRSFKNLEPSKYNPNKKYKNSFSKIEIDELNSILDPILKKYNY